MNDTVNAVAVMENISASVRQELYTLSDLLNTGPDKHLTSIFHSVILETNVIHCSAAVSHNMALFYTAVKVFEFKSELFCKRTFLGIGYEKILA